MLHTLMELMNELWSKSTEEKESGEDEAQHLLDAEYAPEDEPAPRSLEGEPQDMDAPKISPEVSTQKEAPLTVARPCLAPRQSGVMGPGKQELMAEREKILCLA